MTAYRNHTCRIMCAWLLISIGYLLTAQSAGASLTAQTVTGAVDKTEENLQAWQALQILQPVDPGQVVRTGFASKTDIKGDDGSMVYVDEATQLVIRAFEFKPDQQIRIAKFAIIEGTVTAETAHFDYATNVFDIETPTVLASFKYSKAQFVVDRQGNTEITIFNGKFEFTYFGTSTGDAHARYILPNGVEVKMPLSTGGAIYVETTDDGLKVSNIGTSRIIITAGGHQIELSPQASVEISELHGNIVIKNTSSNPEAEVKVNGILLEPNDVMTLTPIATLTPVTSAEQGGVADELFSNINAGNTTSSVPARSGNTETKTEVSTPGTRQEHQTRTVKIPVRANSE